MSLISAPPTVQVPLEKSYRLINHGPTTLISTVDPAGVPNAAAVAWVMPADFTPPLYLAVISAGQRTHSNLMASKQCVINLPVSDQVDLVRTLGSTSGNDGPKLADVPYFPATTVNGVCLAGCSAWLEARLHSVLHEEQNIYLLEAVAAHALTAAVDGRFTYQLAKFPTLHHLGNKVFGVLDKLAPGPLNQS